jgi:23S rRNA pseudouridine1911/1915/1917 synthase
MDPNRSADKPIAESAGWIERYEVGPHQTGWRLDQVLTERLKRASRSQVARIIRAGVRFEDGRPAKPSSRVRCDDVVLVPRVERADPATPSLDSIQVLAEGPDWLAVDKPAGMLVHRTAHEATRTVEAWLATTYADERIEPVHRLDRDTSGVLLCGRGLNAIRSLRGAFAGGRVDKRYIATVEDPDRQWTVGQRRVIETPLGFDPSSRVRLRMGVGDLPCTTHVEVLERSNDRAGLRLRIDGGRQHQIRVHLALAGTPIVGDKLYGMGDEFFLRWIETPGEPDLVAALPTRWHQLRSQSICINERGIRVSTDL